MEGQGISVGRAFADAWEALKLHPVEAILGYFIYAMIGGLVVLIPVLGLFLLFPLMGGYTIFYLKLARRVRPDFGELFAGFSDYWKWVGIGWISIAIFLLVILPLGLTILCAVLILEPIRQAAGGPATAALVGVVMVLLLVIGALASAVLWAVLALRWYFILYAAADGAGVVESFRTSARLTHGFRLRLLAFVLVVGLLILAVTVATCGNGIYFVGPIAELALASFYLSLKHSSEPEAPSE